MSAKNKGIIKLTKHTSSSKESSTKNTNIIKSYGNISRNCELNKNNSKNILPIIHSSFRTKESLEPTSLLTKFIINHTSKIIKNSKEDFIKPHFGLKSKLLFQSKIKGRNDKFFKMYESQSVKLLKSKKNMISSSGSQKLFITEKNKVNNNMNNDRNLNDNILSINNNGNINEEIFINEKEKNNINIPYSNLISDNANSSGPLTPRYNDSQEQQKIILNNINTNSNSNDDKYSRLCSYESIKDKNNKNNLKSSFKKSKSEIMDFFHIYNSDIEYQSKIFNEQIGLLKENLKQYKSFIRKNNFIIIFKSIPLNSKIKFNKSLEEICSILNKLPKIFLGKHYNFMKILTKIEVPNEDKFKSRIVSDEVINVINNNNLLFEVLNYFCKCFEFYLMIITAKEGKKIFLNKREYFELLSNLNKARYNILYIINSFKNAEKNYIKDLSAINQIIKNDKSIEKDKNMNELYDSINQSENLNKNKNINVIDRIKEQLIFKRGEEQGKKHKIERVLGSKDARPINNYLGKIVNNKKSEYKSIFDNKYFDKILLYCNKDVKYDIITQKINNEVNRGKPPKGYKTLKINFN